MELVLKSPDLLRILIDTDSQLPESATNQAHLSDDRSAHRSDIEEPVLDLPERVQAWAGVDLLVNSTSVGLAREGAGPSGPGSDLKALRLTADQLVDPLVVVDLVYGSESTQLAATCMSGGVTFVDGLEILVQQGAESFRIWTGLEPPLEIMRNAVGGHRT